MTTAKQDGDFVDAVISTDLLDNAVQWIGRNLAPEEVFKDSELAAWAGDNGYVKEE